MGDINQATKSVFADKLEPGVIVLRVQALMAENNQSVSAGLLHDPESRQAGLHDHPLSVHTDAIIRNRDEITACGNSSRRATSTRKSRSWQPPTRKSGPSTSGWPDGGQQRLASGRLHGGGKDQRHRGSAGLPECQGGRRCLARVLRETGRGLYETAQADFQWSTRLMIALVVLVILLIAGFAYVLGAALPGRSAMPSGWPSGWLPGSSTTGSRWSAMMKRRS
jgi:methyl-accepting chemotaxis protein